MSRWNYITGHYLNNNTIVCEVLTENGQQDYIYINYDEIYFSSMLYNVFYQFDSIEKLNEFVFISYLLDFSKIDMAPTFDKILDSLPLIKYGGYLAMKQLIDYYSMYHFEELNSDMILTYYEQEK